MYLQTLKELLKEGGGQIHLIMCLFLFQNAPFTVPKRGFYPPLKKYKNDILALAKILIRF